MDFVNSKKVYSKTKFDIKKVINKNKHNIFTGSGGSNNVVIVLESVVLKIIPEFTKSKLNTIKMNNDQIEIKFYDFFTREFIMTNITPHIVGMFESTKIYDISRIFPKCKTADELFFIAEKNISKTEKMLCKLKKYHDHKKLLNKADLLVLEKCTTSIDKEAKLIIESKISGKNKLRSLQKFVNRTIFQFMYTMASIHKLYPNFIHNDMFLRNILAINENKYSDNDYIEYIFNNKHYYLEANGIYIKINDFGFSLNPPYIISTLVEQINDFPLGNMEINNNLRDTYTFLYDYYDGNNFGCNSVMSLLKKKSSFKTKIRNIFKKYLDVQTIDKIHKINRNKLGNVWNIGDSKILKNTVKLPHKYFSDGKFDKYMGLPKDANIVMTYQV